MLILSVLQLAAPQATAPVPPVPALEVITVTARRQPDDSATIPSSIQVIGRSDLRQGGINNASDIGDLSAAVTIVSTFGSSAPQIYLRGVGSNDVNPSANPGIAAYQNETYLASPLGQNLALFDLDRVEIVRGPQGTLFGRNATGGTLIFHTREPDAARGGEANIRLGSFGQRDIEASLNTGDFGQYRGRFAAFVRKSDGWTKNLANGQRANDQDAAGGRFTLVGEVTPSWNINLLVDYAVDRSGMTGHSGLGLFEPPNQASPPPPGSPPKPCDMTRLQAGVCSNILGYVYPSDPSKQGYDRNDREYLDVGGTSLTLSRVGDVNFRSITSYRSARREVREDTDASPLSIVALDFDNSSGAFTQEFLFDGKMTTMTWRGGAFLLHERLATTNRFETLGTLRALGVGFIPDPNFFAFGPFRLNQRYKQNVQSAAAFVETDYQASAKLTLTAGVRLTHETGKFATQTLFDEVIANPVLSPLRGAKVSTDAISWRLAALYAFAPSQSAYASISRGFKSGGFNGGALFASDVVGPLAPEFVITYEAGIKWRSSRVVSGEISVFQNNYDGLQDYTLRSTPPPSRQALDSADARMSGVDASLRALLPLGFSMRASVSLLDAKYVDFVDANGADRSGNRLRVSPRTSSNFSVLWNGRVTPRFGVRARVTYDQRSEIYFDNTNSPLLRSPSSETLAASFSLEDVERRWRIEISGRNLTDQRTLIAALNIANYGFVQQTFAPPRAVQVSFSTGF